VANGTIERFLVRNTRQAIGHQKFTTSEFSDDDSGRPILSQDVSEGLIKPATDDLLAQRFEELHS